MSGLCHVGLHRKRWISFDGADHTGEDAYLRCTNCGLRTINHVECRSVTPDVRAILDAEWAAGRTTRQPLEPR